jgi:hypothetical protein
VDVDMRSNPPVGIQSRPSEARAGRETPNVDRRIDVGARHRAAVAIEVAMSSTIAAEMGPVELLFARSRVHRADPI